MSDNLKTSEQPDQLELMLTEIQTGSALGQHYRELLNTTTDEAQIERLCELAMSENEKYPAAREIALANNYTPKTPGEYILFYYFTEQWDKYEAVAYRQGPLLDNFLRALPPEIQRKAISIGRKVGRSDLVQQLIAQKPVYVPGAEQFMIDNLSEQEYWSELHQLLIEWSPIWGRQILQKLAQADWLPANEAEQNNFKNLLALAHNLSPEIDFGKHQHKRSYSLAPLNQGDRLNPMIAISQQGTIAILENKSQISLYDSADGNLIAKIPVPLSDDLFATRFVFSPDGLYVTLSSVSSVGLGSDIPNKFIIDIQKKSAVSSITKLPIGGLTAFFPDNRVLVYNKHLAQEKASYQIYDIFSETLLESIDGPPTFHISEIVISPNGLFLAGCDVWETLWVWSIPEKQLILSLPKQLASVRQIEFSPDSLWLTFVTREYIFVVDIQTGQTIRQFPVILQFPVHELRPSPLAWVYVKFSPDKQILVIAQKNTPDVHFYRIVNIQTGQTVRRVQYGDSGSNLIFYRPDEQCFHEVEESTTEVKFWRIADGALVDTIQLENSHLLDILFNFQGNNICLLDSKYQVHIWQTGIQSILEKPLKENRLADLAWLEERLQAHDLAADVRDWLEFSVALLKWRWRHEVMLEESGNKAVSPTDIELEG